MRKWWKTTTWSTWYYKKTMIDMKECDKTFDTYNECQEILKENEYRLTKFDRQYFHDELVATLNRIWYQTHKIIRKAMRDIAYIIEYE